MNKEGNMIIDIGEKTTEFTVKYLSEVVYAKSIRIAGNEQEVVQTIVDATKSTLEHVPPELAADLIDRGIVMTGGGLLFRGIDKHIAEATGLPVNVTDEPLKGDCDEK